MALNIPVNLMSTAVSAQQPPAATTTKDTIQPASSSAGTSDAASNSGNGFGAASDRLRQKAPMTQPPTNSTSDGAQSTSVVTAQTTVAVPRDSTTETSEQPFADAASELDRYAPPDPLPTAPILQAASNYAAKRSME